MAQRKKRESGSGTITKRKDGRWEARYTSGINPATGKPIRHCIYGKTQKAVAAKLREVTRDIDTGSYIEPAQYTVAEWMQTYLAEYTMNLKPYALHSYEAVIRNHITPALGKIKLQALNTVQIQAFVNSICRPVCNGGKALSPKTAKNVYGVLHRGLDLAVRIGLLRCNPASSCILPKVPKPEIKTITDEQLDRFLAACRPDLDEAAIRRKTLYLITVMQQMFLRYEIISQILGIDLRQKENRRNFHTQVLHDILEV